MPTNSHSHKCHLLINTGHYDTNNSTGVCLWSGSNWMDGSNVASSGWLNGLVLSLNKSWSRRWTNFPWINTADKEPTAISLCKHVLFTSWLVQSQALGQLWLTCLALFFFRYIQRRDQPETIHYARVLDGCTLRTHDPAVGCHQLYMTSKVCSFRIAMMHLFSGFSSVN